MNVSTVGTWFLRFGSPERLRGMVEDNTRYYNYKNDLSRPYG